MELSLAVPPRKPKAPASMGERLKAARAAKGLGVRELASLASDETVSVPASAITRMESGEQASADARIIVAVAVVLGVTAEWLVRGE